MANGWGIATLRFGGSLEEGFLEVGDIDLQSQKSNLVG